MQIAGVAWIRGNGSQDGRHGIHLDYKGKRRKNLHFDWWNYLFRPCLYIRDEFQEAIYLLGLLLMVMGILFVKGANALQVGNRKAFGFLQIFSSLLLSWHDEKVHFNAEKRWKQTKQEKFSNIKTPSPVYALLEQTQRPQHWEHRAIGSSTEEHFAENVNLMSIKLVVNGSGHFSFCLFHDFFL